MEIIDVEFDENSKIHLEPIYKYKRCWRSLWILKCAYPNYVLKHEINAILTLKDENVIRIKVKEGFKSDLASIPRIFWGIYPLMETTENTLYCTTLYILVSYLKERFVIKYLN